MQVIEKWREPEGKVEFISRELVKITDLGKAFIEGATAAFLLAFASFYLGTDSSTGLLVAFTIIILVLAVILGALDMRKWILKLNQMLINARI